MTSRSAKPRLGRGLASLLSDAVTQPDTQSESIRHLAVDQLRPGPYQPRLSIDHDDLQSLADSIKSSGILQPILVRRDPERADSWQIIAGERRWRAAQLAGLTEAPCLVKQLSDADALAVGLVENLQRKDLDSIEEAEGYRRLAGEFNLTQEGIAEIIGKSRAHVANTLRLLSLPATVQAEVRNGALSAGHARALVTHPNPEQAALQIISRGLNVRQAEALSQTSSRKAKPEKNPDITTVEQDLTSYLGLKVTIEDSGGSGSVRIAYRNLDQLDGLITLLRNQR